MRLVPYCAAALAIAIFSTACSDAPTTETKKAPEPPAAPVTGRQAFQSTFPSARAWAPDCQPLRIRSVNLQQVPSEPGKAGAWEITYVSEQMQRARSFTWSAIEAEGNLHKGVFKGPEEAWSGPRGQEHAFAPAALKIDTTEALEAAEAKSSEYLKRPGTRPPVTYLLEATSRYPDPTWRVMWGNSVSSAEYSVFVDATTGNVLGIVR